MKSSIDRCDCIYYGSDPDGTHTAILPMLQNPHRGQLGKASRWSHSESSSGGRPSLIKNTTAV